MFKTTLSRVWWMWQGQCTSYFSYIQCWNNSLKSICNVCTTVWQMFLKVYNNKNSPEGWWTCSSTHWRPKNIGDHRNNHNDLLVKVGECRRTWRDFRHFKPHVCHSKVLASLFYDIQRRICSHTEQRFLKNQGDWWRFFTVEILI